MEALILLVLIVPFIVSCYGGFLLFMRPPKSVLQRSLLAGLLVGVLHLVVDMLAYYANFWKYDLGTVSVPQATAFYQRAFVDLFTTSMNVLHVPLPVYVTTVLICGSLIYMAIWRCWQGRGRWFSLLLLIATPLFCIYRDISGAMNHSSFQVWNNVPASIALTSALWVVAFYAGFAVFWSKASHIPVPKDEEEHAIA